MAPKTLTEQEILFCELFSEGEAPFGGNASKCYSEAFNEHGRRIAKLAKELLQREDIQKYLNKLEEDRYEEARYMKQYLSAHLKSIIEECSTATFRDRRGTVLSPAPLRSVAVNAIKALTDMYPVKEAQTSKLSIEGGDGTGVVFNITVPQANPTPNVDE